MLPGEMPPISAWCPLEARYILVPQISAQVTTVRSGRCEPPAAGWLVKMTSPISIPLMICSVTAVSIDPRWTGRCGALANNLPFQSKIPQEKSSLSLIFVLIDIFCNTLPIYSAIDISRVEYRVSLIGSGLVIMEFAVYSWLCWDLVEEVLKMKES